MHLFLADRIGCWRVSTDTPRCSIKGNRWSNWVCLKKNYRQTRVNWGLNIWNVLIIAYYTLLMITCQPWTSHWCNGGAWADWPWPVIQKIYVTSPIITIIPICLPKLGGSDILCRRVMFKKKKNLYMINVSFILVAVIIIIVVIVIIIIIIIIYLHSPYIFKQKCCNTEGGHN